MIKRFLHLAVTVNDLATSLATYQALGMKEVERFTCPEPKASVVLMEDHSGVGVELWQFIDTTHEDVKILDGHTAYETDALLADTAALLRQGFTEAMPAGEDDTLQFAILRSPNGKIIELCQYKS